MRLVWSLVAIMFMSTLFVALKDIKQAKSEALDQRDLTPEELQWARQTLNMYDTYYVRPYLFSNDPISWRNYTYEMLEHVGWLFLIFLLWERSRTPYEHQCIAWFFAIQFVDMIDGVVLTHNNAYFYINEFPVTFNVLSIPTYITICILIRYGNRIF